MADNWIGELDRYMDALLAGRAPAQRIIKCPHCGGVMRVSAQEIGDELRVHMHCGDCKATSHADRGPKFPGWETLRA